jgi:hypothetical protein
MHAWGKPKSLGAALVAIALAACTTAVPPSFKPGPTATPGAPSVNALTTLPPATSPPNTAAPTQTPASTPSLTPTEIPSVPATASPTATDFEATIARHLDALAAIAAQHDGIRAGGTSGYDASADYVAAKLAALGLEAYREPVDFTYFNEQAPVSLTVGRQTWTGGEWLHANLYSGEGDVTAVVESVGIRDGRATETAGCESSDWIDFNGGNIALVMTGGCLARDKVRQAQEHDAEALITMVPTWDDPNETLRPTLLDPTLIEIPAVVTGADPIDELLAAAGAGDEIVLTVDVFEEPATDDNVFGEIAGENDEIVMLGGHLDSALDGPGINDNGSGVAALLAIAEDMAAQRAPQRTVRFAFWAAEEFGTLGSADYVRNLPPQERERIAAYLNLDMVGSPNAGYYVYDDDVDPVSRDISDSLVAALSDSGITSGRIPSGGSDHIAFWLAGVSFGGVFSGIAPLTPDEADRYGGVTGEPADPCYHLSCDGRSNVDTATAALFGDAVAVVVEELAY